MVKSKETHSSETVANSVFVDGMIYALMICAIALAMMLPARARQHVLESEGNILSPQQGD
jgi:hypothetical protein